jgi:hypothetical protein
MNHRAIVLLSFFLFPSSLWMNAQLPNPPLPLSPTEHSGNSAADLSIPKDKHESWTELALAKSGLNPSAYMVMLLTKSEGPEFTRELLRVQWRAADPIDLYVVLPHGVVKPRMILYLYDYHFDTDRFRNDIWCRDAVKGGYAAVGFGSALSVQRFHLPRPMKEWFVSELQEALATSTHDVQMILNYLETRSDIDTSRVGFYGQGSGGAIAVLAAQADSRIVALDLLNPWGDWPDWLKESAQIPENERAAYLKAEFLHQVEALDPVVYLPHLTARLRVQQIMDDLVTPLSAKEKIAAVVPHPEQVVRYKDVAAHRVAWRTSGLNAWLREQLSPDSKKDETEQSNVH